jgi:hypothetical protein
MGTEPVKFQCSKCGAAFASADECRKHEQECQGRAAKSGAPKVDEKTKADLWVEDRFEATDN